jgi:two-component system sensor histidine kinase SaeS
VSPQNVTLHCDISNDAHIYFDSMALKNILVNLLYNASKYTEEGSITLRVTEDKIIVEDTGIGIDIQAKDTVFKPFVCLDSSKNRKKSGFGLGLSIAKNLAEKNDYKLELDNAYTHGCRFVLAK